MPTSVSTTEVKVSQNDRAISLLRAARSEIGGLRGHISHLAPKAEAYDVIRKITTAIPLGSQGMSVDIAWEIDEFLKSNVTDAA